MAYDIEEFGSCCTARVIDDLRGFDYDDIVWDGNKRVNLNTYEQYKVWATKELKSCIAFQNGEESEDWDDDPDYGDKYPDIRNIALFFVTLTTEQPRALQFIKEVGFKTTRKVAKGRHPERCLIGGWITGKNLYKWYLVNNK